MTPDETDAAVETLSDALRALSAARGEDGTAILAYLAERAAKIPRGSVPRCDRLRQLHAWTDYRGGCICVVCGRRGGLGVGVIVAADSPLRQRTNGVMLDTCVGDPFKLAGVEPTEGPAARRNGS
jgi:hypothetical protein